MVLVQNVHKREESTEHTRSDSTLSVPNRYGCRCDDCRALDTLADLQRYAPRAYLWGAHSRATSQIKWLGNVSFDFDDVPLFDVYIFTDVNYTIIIMIITHVLRQSTERKNIRIYMLFFSAFHAPFD